MLSGLYNRLANLMPTNCKHLVFTDDRKCVDCGIQLPTEYQMDIYLNGLDKPIGFVLLDMKNMGVNLEEIKEMMYDQVETVSHNFRFMIRGTQISEKQEKRFKAIDVYKANGGQLVIQNFMIGNNDIY